MTRLSKVHVDWDTGHEGGEREDDDDDDVHVRGLRRHSISDTDTSWMQDPCGYGLKSFAKSACRLVSGTLDLRLKSLTCSIPGNIAA